jgi:outer membrane protein OmpA-like peptidoglycan-associated protein
MNKQLLTILFVSILGLSSCTSPGKKTAVGAGVGVAAGAAVGAIIGHQSGNRGKGAALGAALGGALGGTIGNRLDKQAKELEKIAETKRTEDGIITKLKSDILFDTNKATLKNASNINQMAAILKKYPENVLTIKGYTDSTGTDAINKPLSQKRADAVRAQLVEAGVPANTISTMGMGDDNPVGDNKSAAGRAQNRRVEIEITVDESKVPQNASRARGDSHAS